MPRATRTCVSELRLQPILLEKEITPRAALRLAHRSCSNVAEPQRDIAAESRGSLVVLLKKKAESVPPAAQKLTLRS